MKIHPSISLHQINTITGDIKGNLKTILKCIEVDIENKIEISVFPETAFTGYMCGALWDNMEFITEQIGGIKEIKSILKKLKHKGAVIIGFIEFDGLKKDGGFRLYNSAAIISTAGIKITRKIMLASRDHHEDQKYFIPGEDVNVFNIDLPSGRIRIGVPICEDMWYNNHIRNIPKEMVEKYGADMIVNINQSYFYYGKQKLRYEMLKTFSSHHNVPIIYCNTIGVGDIVKNIVIFDGGSMILNEKGELMNTPHQFREWGISLYDWKLKDIKPCPACFGGGDYENERCLVCSGTGKKIDKSKRPKFIEYSKYREIWEALIFEQKEFFRLCGLEKAQVHLSGGLDSAITACLAVAAMGKENVVFITNPSDLNSNSLKYVHYLVGKLGCGLQVNPIQSIYEEFMNVDKSSFGDELNDTGKASVQAVLRTVQGLAASHRFKSGIIATGNHTEIVLGWASFHDIGSIGVHAIIGDMSKSELFEFAKFINIDAFGKEVIPKEIYDGTFKPSAELPDAPGEDPIDYNIYSGICTMLIRDRASLEQISGAWRWASKIGRNRKDRENWDNVYGDKFKDYKYLLKYTFKEFEAHIIRAQQLMKRSFYKTAQGAPIVIISPRSRGFSNRETLINHYE